MRRNSTTRALDARPLIGKERSSATSPVTIPEGGRDVVTAASDDTAIDDEPPWAVRQLKSELPSITSCRIETEGDEEPTRPLQSVDAPVVVAGHLMTRKLGSDGATGLWVCERVMSDGAGRKGFAKFLPMDVESYTTARSHLFSEAQVASAFSHPSLVNLDFADEDSQGCLLVYDHLHGTNLGRVNAQLWARGEALPLEVAVWITCETLRGLHYLHTHRDRGGRPLNLVTSRLAPGQVLLTEGGHVRLATFALEAQPQETAFIGPQGPEKTSAYTAPECLLGSPRGPTADLYAVGATLYELLTGRPLLPDCRAHEIHARAIEGDLGLQSLDDEEVPTRLREIVRRALSRDPERRYPDAAGMAAELAAWMVAEGQHAMPSTIGRFLVHEGLLQADEDAYGPLARPPSLVSEHDSTRPTELVRGDVASMFRASFGKRPQVSSSDFVLGPGTLSAIVIGESADPLAARSPWSVVGSTKGPETALHPVKPPVRTPSRASSMAAPIAAPRDSIVDVAPSPWSLINSATPGDGPTQQLPSLPMAELTTIPQPQPRHSLSDASLSAIYVLDAHKQRRLTAMLCSATAAILAVLLVILFSR